MTPRERRARLFRTSKPFVRPAMLIHEGGFGEDMGILWAAYKAGSFPLMDSGKDMAGFAKSMIAIAASLHEVAIIEDDNRSFQSGRGPVAIIGIRSDGWRYEPHIDYFKWATRRNILRATIQFLQMARYSKEVGVVILRSLKETSSLFMHAAKDYGVLNFVGRIPHGTARGDEYLFSTMGRKEAPKGAQKDARAEVREAA